ncbi:helix-turn-helix transcriptional regulator [Alicyclobacillus macrosporangiidus]|uniref:ArsR/SmtB family transcription factor n=1 Tax=Alicyclobacillus macrosporangiidus TaxID=392015 RepID=UPI0026F0501D|nr:metalloregulator ArsR/SmtB family transcription factor [Alicyclobacillus macrosporangiidus]
MLDTYAVIAEPSRRRILDRLLQSDSSVSELARDLGLSQPLISKHLRTLRESGLVQVRVEAQRRIYSLNAAPLAEIDEWLSAYRMRWNQHVDALAEHLEQRKRLREGTSK